MPVITPPGSAYVAEDDLRVRGQGLLAESFPRASLTSQTLMTTQKLEGALVGLNAGQTVTGVAFACQANSASLTRCQSLLYDTAGNLLAAATNTPAKFDAAAGTVVAFPFSAPYKVTITGAYYLAIHAVGTTPPTLYRGANTTVNGGVSPGVAAFVLQTGQATPPNPATFSTETVTWWMAAY